jgi:hypothetical protein
MVRFAVELRKAGARSVKAIFDSKEDAESYMADLDRWYDGATDCLWLVEIDEMGNRKDLYGYT